MVEAGQEYSAHPHTSARVAQVGFCPDEGSLPGAATGEYNDRELRKIVSDLDAFLAAVAMGTKYNAAMQPDKECDSISEAIKSEIKFHERRAQYVDDSTKSIEELVSVKAKYLEKVEQFVKGDPSQVHLERVVAAIQGLFDRKWCGLKFDAKLKSDISEIINDIRP